MPCSQAIGFTPADDSGRHIAVCLQCTGPASVPSIAFKIEKRGAREMQDYEHAPRDTNIDDFAVLLVAVTLSLALRQAHLGSVAA